MHWKSEEGREVAHVFGLEIHLYNNWLRGAHWRVHDPFLFVNTSGGERPARGSFPIFAGNNAGIQSAKAAAELWVSHNLGWLQELSRLREAWTDWARHVSAHQEDADSVDMMRGAWKVYESAAGARRQQCDDIRAALCLPVFNTPGEGGKEEATK